MSQHPRIVDSSESTFKHLHSFVTDNGRNLLTHAVIPGDTSEISFRPPSGVARWSLQNVFVTCSLAAEINKCQRSNHMSYFNDDLL